MTNPIPDPPALYRALCRIRAFEETVLENFPRGVFFGTTHTYLGQEANAVGVLSHCLPQDIVFSNHRCHGHFLAYGGDPRALFAELMGKASGVCGGRGGSQHLQWKNFYSNGIQGGIVPVATGMALAEKLQGRPAVVFTFLGDGTMGEGVLYEALNLANLWHAPVLFVLENNHIAQTTPIEIAVAGSLAARFTAFGIPVQELDSSDILEIYPVAGNLVDEIRQTQTPRALILNTCRFGPHSKGDDTRSLEALEQMKTQRDPLLIQAARLESAQINLIHFKTGAEIAEAFQNALTDPFPIQPDPGISI
ncbi:MAG TPA: thiamine pyrophosphate-dependent dehydrogenase E1 component subunit alpha [Anaerolineales bacterium]|nr:thiamine pyrophosphate-dependent dehydrogenase E1 component subunit alpha [Anaerolineales bacterium]